MERQEKDGYMFNFKGAKLSKRETNKAGLAIIFGVVGIFVALFITGWKNKIIDYAIIAIFVLIGYFWIGNKIFKSNNK